MHAIRAVFDRERSVFRRTIRDRALLMTSERPCGRRHEGCACGGHDYSAAGDAIEVVAATPTFFVNNSLTAEIERALPLAINHPPDNGVRR
jgi:hypothetical protein